MTFPHLAAVTAWLSPAAGLALLAAVCYAAALVATRHGLRHVRAATGTRISVSTTALAFWALAPWLAPAGSWSGAALARFAAVGLFFPVVVTLLTYGANARMGPSTAGALGATTPLFAVAGSVTFLGESPTLQVWCGVAAIVAGAVALSWQRPGARAAWPLWAMALPLSAAALRGLAQIVIKSGLALQPSPFLAGWTGYTVSAAVAWVVLGWRGGGRAGSGQGSSPISGSLAAPFVLAGLSNGTAVLLTYWALQLGTVSVVAPVIATTPLFALALSAALLRSERIHAAMLAGVALTVLGVVLLLLRQKVGV